MFNNVWISVMSYFHCSSDHGGYTDYKVELQQESEDQDVRRGMITSIDNVTQVSRKFRKKKKTTKTWV